MKHEFEKEFPSLEEFGMVARNRCMLPMPPLQLEENGKFKVGWGKHQFGEVTLVSNVHRDSKEFDGVYFEENIIQQNCLDKKKVEEAIMNMVERSADGLLKWKRQENTIERLMRLMKELGLEVSGRIHN